MSRLYAFILVCISILSLLEPWNILYSRNGIKEQRMDEFKRSMAPL